jgi:hypothetical protein
MSVMGRAAAVSMSSLMFSRSFADAHTAGGSKDEFHSVGTFVVSKSLADFGRAV